MVRKWTPTSVVMAMKTEPRLPDDADCLYSMTDLERALDRLAQDIESLLDGPDPLLVLTVMNGGLVTAGHLLPRLAIPLEVDYVHATRYGHRQQGGEEIHWLHWPDTELAGRRVLIVDDILDRGLTLQALVQACREQKVRSVHTVALVQKQLPLSPAVEADFVGLTVPDRFVFGFGMDYQGLWRNAPGIFALPEPQSTEWAVP